jgi:hypothetical protein
MFSSLLKSFPPTADALTRSQICAQDWQLLRGDLALPLAVLKQPALQHNLHWMRDFCAQRGLHLAPHGKTSMSPELWQMQLDAGAWGISFATVFQAAVGARHSVPVLLIANQVIQRAELDALALLHAERSALRSMFLVDSIGQVDAIEAWAADRAVEAEPAVADAVPGLHLEGPFLSPEDGARGAHAAAFVRAAFLDELGPEDSPAFRALVRDLARVFRTRIEMRQIGVRDEAKLLDGVGPRLVTQMEEALDSGTDIGDGGLGVSAACVNAVSGETITFSLIVTPGDERPGRDRRRPAGEVAGAAVEGREDVRPQAGGELRGERFMGQALMRGVLVHQHQRAIRRFRQHISGE